MNLGLRCVDKRNKTAIQAGDSWTGDLLVVVVVVVVEGISARGSGVESPVEMNAQ